MVRHQDAQKFVGTVLGIPSPSAGSIAGGQRPKNVKYYERTQHLAENKESRFEEPSKCKKNSDLFEVTQHMIDNKWVSQSIIMSVSIADTKGAKRCLTVYRTPTMPNVQTENITNEPVNPLKLKGRCF